MIVWGGNGTIGGYLNTGGRYNPSTNTWTATSTTNAPSARVGHTAIWTGSEMIVWGGYGRRPFEHWRKIRSRHEYVDSHQYDQRAPARDGHTAVWTGNEMIVWGGYDRHQLPLNTGGRYNPSTNSWTATSLTNAPPARYGHTAVWTGSEMIVWGGYVLDDPGAARNANWREIQSGHR